MSDILTAERQQVEIDKLIAERQKLLDEEFKLRAEEFKLRNEGKKLEHAFYPAVLLISGMGIGAALMGAAIAIVRHFH